MARQRFTVAVCHGTCPRFIKMGRRMIARTVHLEVSRESGAEIYAKTPSDTAEELAVLPCHACVYVHRKCQECGGDLYHILICPTHRTPKNRSKK